MEESHVIHITHNDADAVGCALVAVNLYPDTDIVKNTHFCAIGTQEKILMDMLDKDIEDDRIPEMILFSDISISEEFCCQLESIASLYKIILIGYDHHDSNHLHDKHKWFHVVSDNSTFDPLVEDYTLVSATWLMHEALINEMKVPDEFTTMVKMISRYDTWTWRSHPYDWTNDYPNMYDELIATICKDIGPEKTFDELLPLYMIYDDGNIKANKCHMVPEYFYTIFNIHKNNEQRYLDSLGEKCRITKMGEYVYALIPCENNFANAACEYVYNTYEFVDIVAVIYLSSNKVGLRTNKPNINVAEIASIFPQSGGHVKASGATVPATEMLACTATYLLNSIKLKDYGEWKVKHHVPESEIETKTGESSNT